MINLEDIKITPLLDTLELTDIPDDVYFSEKYSKYISNSRLGLINPEQGGDPDKFFTGGFTAFSDSLIFGSAVHTLVLQPEDFVLNTAVNRPTGKVGYISDYVYDKYKEVSDSILMEAAAKYDYYGGMLSAKRLNTLRIIVSEYISSRSSFEKECSDKRTQVYLDERGRERLDNCINSLYSHSEIKSLLHPDDLFGELITGYEKAVLLNVQIDMPDGDSFVLALKSKLDQFTLDVNSNVMTINDIKTTSRLYSQFSSAIDSFHYTRELGMYAYLLNLIAKHKYNMVNPTLNGNFLVVCTVPDHTSGIYKMTKSMFNKGFQEFKHLLRLVAYHVSTNPEYRHIATV